MEPPYRCEVVTIPTRPPARGTRNATAVQQLSQEGDVQSTGSERGSLMNNEPEVPEVIPVPPPAPEAELTPRALLGGLAIDDPTALSAELDRYTTVRGIFVDWLFSHLVAGIDYLLIHRKVGARGNKQDCPDKLNATGSRCDKCGGKATLAKPGSEKICGLLQLRATFRRDVETWEMLGSEPGVVALICELVGPSGVIVAEGRGARHRDQDFGDLNKCIKMVQKSSQVDSVLRCAGLSELFSQDIEDMPGFMEPNGDTEAGEFTAPKSKSGAAPAASQPTLQAQLEESVRRTAPAPAARPAPRPIPRPAPPRAAAGRPSPAYRQDPPAGGTTPPDALSPARVNRLMAILHEEIRRAEVPQEQHEGVFADARAYLTEWVGQNQGRERLSDCSWKAYDELCAQVPAAVDAALSGQAPPRRPRPRLVRRYGGAPRSFNTPRSEF